MTDQVDTSKYKILVVDDVATNVLIAENILKLLKYNTIHAFSGKEALEVCRQECPDLILLDVMMPDMSGLEVAQILKDDDSFSGIPIIFLSALNEVDDIVKGFEVGGKDYIEKPIKPKLLGSRVYNQISILDKEREVVRQSEELREAIRNRDRLYSIMAHDLRSPLATIKMVLNMVTMEDNRSKIENSLFEMIQMANQISDEAFLLLDNLLKWTKNQIQGLTVSPRNMQLNPDIVGVIQIIEPISSLKKITFRFLGEGGLNVYADPDIVKTVMRNLLNNAFKFSYKDSYIEIRTYEQEGKAVVEVKDHGVGIKEQDKDKIFGKMTFSTTGTDKEQGTGIGLNLCRELAHLNGGDLWFESSEGIGSTFFFSMPLVQSGTNK